jgi:hypothetical protein
MIKLLRVTGLLFAVALIPCSNAAEMQPYQAHTVDAFTPRKVEPAKPPRPVKPVKPTPTLRPRVGPIDPSHPTQAQILACYKAHPNEDHPKCADKFRKVHDDEPNNVSCQIRVVEMCNTRLQGHYAGLSPNENTCPYHC